MPRCAWPAVSPPVTVTMPYGARSTTSSPAAAELRLSDELKPGDFHGVDTKVTHSLSNEGPATGQLFEIELK